MIDRHATGNRRTEIEYYVIGYAGNRIRTNHGNFISVLGILGLKDGTIKVVSECHRVGKI